MEIIYGKNLSISEETVVENIAHECGVSFDTAKLLFYRGIVSVAEAKHFLSPSKDWFFDPMLLSGMKEGTERIKTAKDRGERVLIFGDYDADGVCATTVLSNSLKDFGIRHLRSYVPERDEGYGLNIETIKRLLESEKIDLLITVDCGISDYDVIEEIKGYGIDVIVTDHHEPPEILPDCIRINPKIKGQDYPFSGLCGAGVAYKVGYALMGEKANDYLDYVSLATVADSMDLISENRDIVYEGLKLFNNKRSLRLPFKYLLSDFNREVTAQTLAYNIAPRINAGGRMGDASCALRLFTSTDPNEIFDLAVKLNTYNVERQVQCDIIYNEAKAIIQQDGSDKKNIILVKDKNWQTGFIGIVAARLVEEYSRPCIVFAGYNGFYKGSARSVDGINIHDAIVSAKDLLIGFGGHAQAAGLSVEENKFDALDERLNQYIKNEYGKVDTEEKVYAEWNINTKFPIDFAREIDLLEPFGVANRRPLFTTDVKKVVSTPLRQGSPHYSFKTSAIEMLDFNGEKDVLPLSLPMDKKVLFEVNLSTFRNRQSIKGYARGVYLDFSPSDEIKPYIFESKLHSLREETNKDYKNISYKDVVVDKSLKTAYILSDMENLKYYPQLKSVDKSLFEKGNNSGNQMILIGQKSPVEGYDRVIYLDKPFNVLKNQGETFVVSDLTGCGELNELSTSRSDFAEMFRLLRSLTNKSFVSLTEFAIRHAEEQNVYMMMFALGVFMELKIFGVKNGVLVYDEKIKNALTNSELYSKIDILSN